MPMQEQPTPPVEQPPEVKPTATGASLTEKQKIEKASNSPEFLVWSGILVAVCLLAAVVFLFLDRWRKRAILGDDDREESLSLSNFRELYENGEITEAEYRKVRDKLAASMKAKLGLAGKPSTASGPKPILPAKPTEAEQPKPPDAI